jgi:hypothetical protein
MKSYPAPWTVKRGMACHTVVDGQGVPIAWMLLARPLTSTSSDEQIKAATLMAIAPESLEQFKAFCERERCPFAVVGVATEERHLTVANEDVSLAHHTGASTEAAVNMPMNVLLGKPPTMLRDVKRESNPIDKNLNSRR